MVLLEITPEQVEGLVLSTVPALDVIIERYKVVGPERVAMFSIAEDRSFTELSTGMVMDGYAGGMERFLDGTVHPIYRFGKFSGIDRTTTTQTLVANYLVAQDEARERRVLMAYTTLFGKETLSVVTRNNRFLGYDVLFGSFMDLIARSFR